MAITRACEQCGTAFLPRREHSRFCSAQCRVAWNCEHARHEGVSSAALDWSLTAMTEATARLARSRPSGAGAAEVHAVVAVSDAVWWVTIVDATLVRYHPEAYETALAGLPRAQRLLTEGTFAGLRYVRNRMGYFADHADFIQPRPSAAGDQDAPIAAWTWKAMSKPPLDTLPPRGQAWEMNRYWAYQERLAGHAIGETFNLAADFLTLASSDHAA